MLIRKMEIKYHLTEKVINRFVRQAKITKRLVRCSVDDSYFEKINTEEKAYFLGFIFADGSINNGYLSIELHIQDQEILEKFIKSIKYTGSVKNYIKNNGCNTATLHIGSIKIVDDLNNLGCISKKSLILKFPNSNQVPDKFLKDFIRGYFDGDGSFTQRTRKNSNSFSYSASIISSCDFCQSLSDFLSKKLNIYIRHKKYLCKNKIDKYSVLSLDSRIDISILLNWLYKDSKIYLKRKYEKYKSIEEAIKILPKHGRKRISAKLFNKNDNSTPIPPTSP